SCSEPGGAHAAGERSKDVRYDPLTTRRHKGSNGELQGFLPHRSRSSFDHFSRTSSRSSLSGYNVKTQANQPYGSRLGPYSSRLELDDFIWPSRTVRHRTLHHLEQSGCKSWENNP